MLNTNQKAKPKQNKKPKQNEGKIANKKLKKTRIGGGETTPQQLKIKLETILTSLEVSFGDILKNTNNKELLIEAIQNYKNAGYEKQYQDDIMRAVKDALGLLLKKNTNSTEKEKVASPDEKETSPDEKETSPDEINVSLPLSDENTTEPDASTGYEKFKSLVEVFTENIVNLKPLFTNNENPKDIKFKENIYRIYTDGIVLLNITVPPFAVANVYKPEGYVRKHKTLDNIVEFLTKSENCLIIVNRTETNDNYVYDCMLQILYKLVKILLDSDNLQKYIDKYLNNEDDSPVSSEKQEIKKEEVLNELIQAIYENLKDETIDKYTIEKHRVLLRSLIFIRYGVDKDIKEETFKTVKEAYMKQFGKNKALADALSNFKYTEIVDTNILGQASYFPLNCMSNSMIESFQHILNAMSSSSNSITEDDKKILIKLSDGLLTSDCKRTIKNIIETKSYLLSEPLIMSEDIKRNYISKIKGKPTIEEIKSVNKHLIKFRNKIAAIIITVEDVNTKNTLSKIYTDLKDNITKKYKKTFTDILVDNIEDYSNELNTNVTGRV